MWILIIIGIVIISLKIIIEYKNFKRVKYINKDNELYSFNGKLNKKILTNNELNFYMKIKKITDKYNLVIFPKIRMADIISTNNYNDFNKIKSKHIDFTICKNDSTPILFIELDDSTHKNKKNKENDDKKNLIMQSILVKILRVKTNEINKNLIYIENIIKSKIGSI